MYLLLYSSNIQVNLEAENITSRLNRISDVNNSVDSLTAGINGIKDDCQMIQYSHYYSGLFLCFLITPQDMLILDFIFVSPYFKTPGQPANDLV